MVAEGNYFEKVVYPCYSVSSYADGEPGCLVQRSNAFAGSGTCEAGGTVTEASTYFSYQLDPALPVPVLVTAGARVGRLEV